MIMSVSCSDCRSTVTVSCSPETRLGTVLCFSCSRRRETDRQLQEAARRRLESSRRRAARNRSMMDRLERAQARLDRLKGVSP